MSEGDGEIVKEFTRRFATGGHVTDESFDPEIVWELDHSKVVRFRLFASRELAFEAAGMSG
jgi:hypothetical protein